MDEFLRLPGNQKRCGAACVGLENRSQSEVVQTPWVSLTLSDFRGSHFDNKCFKDTIENAMNSFAKEAIPPFRDGVWADCSRTTNNHIF